VLPNKQTSVKRH